MTARFGRRFVSAPALLFVIALLVMLMPGGARMSRAAQDASQQGDVNCDANVNSIDSLQILRSVAGLSTTAPCLADAGDVNCDGAVNSIDSLRILRHVAGLSNTTPNGCIAISEPLAPPPTSEALIAQALADGDITPEESLLYRAYALFDDPRLPAEFHSPVLNLHAAMALFGEIDQEEAGLSPALLADLAPFRVRPADPASIFNNPPERTGVARAAAASTWVSKPVSGAGARVWVKASPDAESQLTSYAAAVGKVWARLPGIFTYPDPDLPGHPTIDVNPDGAVDFYFVDGSDLDPRIPYCADHPEAEDCRFGAARDGYAQRAPTFHGNASSGYVVLDRASSGDNLLYDIAHELTHAAQFAYDVNETSWLMESTAAWSAYRVLKELGTWPWSPYSFAREFLHRDWLQLPLTRNIDLSAYESWPFFLFASMEKGDGIVTKIWETAAAPGQQGIEAVDANLPLDAHFDNFSVRNWNQDPVPRQYKTADLDFPTDTPKPDTIIFFGPDESQIEETLEPLSAHYYSYTFDAPVRTIILHNKLNGKPHANIWGIAKIDGEWQEPEDWTAIAEKTWCRDAPGQELEELIVIFSNSGITSTVTSSESSVEANSLGCPGWHGTVSSTYQQTWPGYSGKTETVAATNVRFELNDLQPPNPKVQLLGTVSGQVQWTHSEYDGDCSGQTSGVYPVGPYGQLRIWDDGGERLRYEGVGAGTGSADTLWITLTCPGYDAERAVTGGYETWFVMDVLEEHRIEPDGKTIRGTYTLTRPQYGDTQTWEWEFHRVP